MAARSHLGNEGALLRAWTSSGELLRPSCRRALPCEVIAGVVLAAEVVPVAAVLLLLLLPPPLALLRPQALPPQ